MSHQSKSRLIRLYPLPGGAVDAAEIYLGELHRPVSGGARPFIYANFLSSLDGRIALGDGAGAPQRLRSATDWLLFKQLQAHADCLVTHSGYLRDLAGGRLGNILSVTDPRLIDWRRKNGMMAQPKLIIVSASLNFPLDDVAVAGRDVTVVTTASAAVERVRRFEDRGLEVVVTEDPRIVSGRTLMASIERMGCSSVYLQAGPTLAHRLAGDRLLDRLYLSQPHTLVGGEDFHTIMGGARFHDAVDLALRSLYLEQGDRGNGQLLFCFDTLDLVPG